ncbi:MAG TPA: deoxyribonuclease IV [Thermoplasmata archaeon]|nr:deoxyribonuclease IV [Thermoplasmata archaeon]
MWLGAHIRTSDGLAEAARVGHTIGCEAIQIFSKSPHSWKAPPIRPESAEEFRAAVPAERLRSTAIHHAYLTNLATPKAGMLKTSRAAFLDEIHRADLLAVDHVIFHPGAHMGTGVEKGCAQIAESLNWVAAETPDSKVRILLENAAGQGTTIGSKLEELASILERLTAKDRFGVTIDTCHLFASGVDFRTAEQYGAVKDLIRDTIGTKKVRAFHLNDSKAECGGHLDRHQNIGKGAIGTAGFAHWLNDPTWAKLPGFLETPLESEDYSEYVQDLQTLRGLLQPPA